MSTKKKHYTKTEIGFALLGLGFAIFGLYVIFFPNHIAFYSPASPESDFRMRHTPTQDVAIYASDSRVYVFGTIAVIVGCSMALMALFPWQARKGNLLED